MKNKRMKSTLKISTALIVVFSFVAAACGGSSDTATTNPPATSTTLVVTETTQEVVDEVVTETTAKRLTDEEIYQQVVEKTPPVPDIPAWTDVYTLTAKERRPLSTGQYPKITIPIYDAPDGEIMWPRDGNPTDPTPWKERLTFYVTKGVPGDEWAEVLLSSRPNESRGWVRTSQFEWSGHRYHMLIDLSNRTVTVWNGDELIVHTLAIVGRSSRPTPILKTAVEVKLDNPKVNGSRIWGEAYGTRILMVTAFSETLESFNNGIPQIAIHGTDVPLELGNDISSGCIRIHNTVIDMLYEELPLGTVVNIVA